MYHASFSVNHVPNILLVNSAPIYFLIAVLLMPVALMPILASHSSKKKLTQTCLSLYSYSIQNVSVWDVMVGKNKGQNLLDLIVRVESQEPQGIMASESSDSVLNDPRVTWEIRRPYES